MLTVIDTSQLATRFVEQLSRLPDGQGYPSSPAGWIALATLILALVCLVASVTCSILCRKNREIRRLARQVGLCSIIAGGLVMVALGLTIPVLPAAVLFGCLGALFVGMPSYLLLSQGKHIA